MRVGSPDVIRRTLSSSVVVLLMLGGIWLYAPWRKHWWPGRHEASSAPSPCGVVDLPSVRQAVSSPHVQPGEPAQEDSEFRSDTSCTWRISDDLVFDPRFAGTGLQIGYSVLRGDGGSGGGIEAAKKQFSVDKRVLAAGQVRIEDLGDEAFAAPSGRRATVVARKSNVILELRLTAPTSQRVDSLANAEHLAWVAVGKIRLDA